RFARGVLPPWTPAVGTRVSSALVDHASRRTRLASRLGDLQAEAFLVTRLPNVRYLTGFTGSNGQFILRSADGIFLTDGRYAEQARHEAPDLNRTVYSGQFARAFGEACADLGVHTIAFEASGVSYKLYTELLATGVELIPTTDEVESLRTIKDPEELRAVEAAQAVADDAFEAIVLKLSEGVTEKEIALELDTTMRRLGADALAFETILAFGESAAEPHHTPSERALLRGDVVKMDFGCVVDGYHSDMTRTVFFGDPSADLRAVYEIVRTAQQVGVETARPGISGSELDGVVRGVIKEAGYGDQFGHGLGHGVGLEIHEAPWLRVGGKDVLAEGTVVTVEPGIYLAGVGGVRIEDMVALTADGCRVLPGTPKELLIL
ncbi:MAG: M24 family metallopeptidase, partial [Actinomycetota bacterium]